LINHMDTAMTNSATHSISPQELNARLGRIDAPLVLDVRRAPAFAASTHILAGAQRCAPEDLAAFAQNQTPREVVVYCVYGHNVSDDAATTLRAAGWQAHALAGGIEGGEDGVDDLQRIKNWRGQPAISIAKRPDWGVTGEQPSRWITRERPKIDRIACPWLIRRFIDPRAEFFYVPANEVLVQAQRERMVPYDIVGAAVSHEGELCSFDALLNGFDLRSPALDILARIVRGADIDRLDIAAQSAGLLALSLGLSRLHAHDDHAMLGAAMPMYDALFAWCSDKARAQDEPHNWTPR
jgi:rhodanese-related sulfurtransferase